MYQYKFTENEFTVYTYTHAMGEFYVYKFLLKQLM